MKKYYTLCIFIGVICAVFTSCSLQNNTTPKVETTVTIVPTTENDPEIEASTEMPIQLTTQTPIETLNSENILSSFTNLIRNNNQCKLPCWLGIVPIQSETEDVSSLFSQYNIIASTKISPELAYMRVFFPNFESATHDVVTNIFFTENGKVSQTLVAASTYQDKNGPLDFNNLDYQQLMQAYFLPSIFTTHGPPEFIFLDTTRILVDPARNYPFVLWIIYPDQGFLIRYEGNNTEVEENIIVCPMQSRIEIKIWDIETNTYETFMENDEVGGVSMGPQPIQSVSEFNIMSFYDKFRTAQTNTCFETSSSFWPH